LREFLSLLYGSCQVSFIGLFCKRERLLCACLHPCIHKAVSDCGEQNALSFAKEPYKRALIVGSKMIRQAHSMLIVSQENMDKRKQHIITLAAQLKEAQQV